MYRYERPTRSGRGAGTSSSANANTCDEPVAFHGSTSSASRGMRGRRPSNSEWFVAITTAAASARAVSSGSDWAGTCGSWRATCASSRSTRRISLAASESRRSSESRLKVSPSTATLQSRSEPPSRRFIPSTRNSGTDSWTRETARSMPGALARRRPDAADDARQRRDLLEEVVLRDPLRDVRDEQVLADREAAALLEVARDPLGRAGGDRRAQDDRLPGVEQRQELLEGAPYLGDVDLDVAERGRAEREHDVVGRRGGRQAARQLEPAG